MKKLLLLLLIFNLITIQIIKASGGFDHGTATGKNKLQIDLTINPFDLIENGQSYIVLSYGLSNTLDFHSYLSHEPTGTNQYYYGKHISRFISIMGWRFKFRWDI